MAAVASAATSVAPVALPKAVRRPQPTRGAGPESVGLHQLGASTCMHTLARWSAAERGAVVGQARRRRHRRRDWHVDHLV